MKVIVQVPCLDEEATLPRTLADIPRQIPGVDSVEILVIDDGSRDRTVEAARAAGVEHILSFKKRRGLAKAFTSGLDTALRLGADIVVNTDADNQYCGWEIPRLIQPILEGRADLVVGDRHTDQLAHFSLPKRLLQKWGTRLVRWVSGTPVTDATSGFRAYDREAAMRVMVYSRFSYTLETILQAGIEGLAIETIRVKTNPPTRRSRLFKSVPQYLRYSLDTLVRVYTMYNPMRVFLLAGLFLASGGMAIGTRFLYYYVLGQGAGRIQSLILAGALLIIGFQVALIGLLADVIANNRKILEDVLVRIKRIEYGRSEQELLAGPDERPSAPSASDSTQRAARE